MGVKGLWQVLERAGEDGTVAWHPVDYGSLQGKVLAVDASIWLYQFVKSIPASKDATVPPLVMGGLFQRVCKLLYFGVKPVFVFDGAAPAIKKETMQLRHEARRQGDLDYAKLARRILKNKLKLMALETLDETTPSTEKTEMTVQAPIELVAMLESSDASDGEGTEIDWDIDISSSEFKVLPYAIQEQIILGSRKRTIDATLIAAKTETQDDEPSRVAEDGLAFSKAQIEALVKRRKLMNELETVRGNPTVESSTTTGRGRMIASNAEKAYIFVKNSRAGWTLSLNKPAFDEADSLCEGVATRETDKKRTISDIEDDDECMEMMFGREEAAVAVGAETAKASSSDSEWDFDVPCAKSHSEGDQQTIQMDVECRGEEATPEMFNHAHEQRSISFLRNMSLASMQSESVSPYVTTEPAKPVTVISPDLTASFVPPAPFIPLAPPAPFIPLAPPAPSIPLAPSAPSISLVPSAFLSSSPSSSDSDKSVLDDEYQEFIAHVSKQSVPSESSVKTLPEEEYNELVDRLKEEIQSFKALSEAALIAKTSPTKTLSDAFMEMLHHFNLPFIVAPFEAEAQCAALAGVDGIVSDDSDCLLFGGTCVYRGFFGGRAGCRVFSAASIATTLHLSRHDLIVLAHLLGSDYCGGLEGIGPKRAVELVKYAKRHTPQDKHDDVSALLATIVGLFRSEQEGGDTENGADADADADADVAMYRKWMRGRVSSRFADPQVTRAFLHPIVAPVDGTQRWGRPDRKRLEEFMVAWGRWSRDRTGRALDDLDRLDRRVARRGQ